MTKIQYGCDVNVWELIRNAIKSSCLADCDRGTKQEVDVKKWEGDRDRPSDAKLGITVSSHFLKDETGNILTEAILKTITPETVTQERKSWEEHHSLASQNYGMQDAKGDCTVTTFPNFVHVQRFDGDNMRDTMSFLAELAEVESKSFPPTIPTPLRPNNMALSGRSVGTC